jgi:hypothetical protein
MDEISDRFREILKMIKKIDPDCKVEIKVVSSQGLREILESREIAKYMDQRDKTTIH